MARTAVLLLGSAWLLRDAAPYWIALSLSVAAAMAHDRRIADGTAHLLLRGSYALLLIALVLNLADKLVYHLDSRGSAAERLARWLQIWNSDGVALTAAMVLLWWALRRSATAPAACLGGVVGIACAISGSIAWHSWTERQYTRASYSAFAPWRAAIPEGAEVLWPGIPVGAWYLLERPSYWSPHQSVWRLPPNR